MAKACPCGCGRSIGMTQRRQANRALYIDSLLPLARRALATTVPEDKGKWAAHVESGEYYRDMFLDFAHLDELPPNLGEMSLTEAIDEAKRTLPASDIWNSMSQLKAFTNDADDWEADTLRLAKTLRKVDAEWYKTWPGPRRKL